MRKTVTDFVKTTYITVLIVLLNSLIYAVQQLFSLNLDQFAGIPQQMLNGNWGDLITTPWLHMNCQHLALNMFTLLIIGPVAEHFYGHARYLALYLASGIGGTLIASLIFRTLATANPAQWAVTYTATRSLGASIAMAGVIVAAAVVLLPLPFPRRQLGKWWNMAAFAYAAVAMIPFGSHSTSATGVLHIGGACVGAIVLLFTAARMYHRTA